MESHSQYDVINRNGVIVHRFAWLKFMKFFNEQIFFLCVYRPTHSLLLPMGYRCEVPTLIGTREFLVSMPAYTDPNDPSSLLYRYRGSFLEVKEPGRGFEQHPSIAEDKNG
jgi:hypothetical protein